MTAKTRRKRLQGFCLVWVVVAGCAEAPGQDMGDHSPSDDEASTSAQDPYAEDHDVEAKDETLPTNSDAIPTDETIGEADAGAFAATDAGVSAVAPATPPAPAPVAIPAPSAALAPSAEHVPMFVAQAAGKRTAASCNEGRSWSVHDPGGGSTSDHSAGAAQGLAYGNGRFVAAFGWGEDGSLRTTDKPVDWAHAHSNQAGFAGVAWLGDKFVAVDGKRVLSSADGSHWQAGTFVNLQAHARRITGLRTSSGWVAVITAYAAVGDSGDARQLAISHDRGASWKTIAIGDCVRAQQFSGGVAFGQGVMVSVGSNGNACRSTDNGHTWQAAQNVGGGVGSVIWDGQRFYAVGGSRAFVSPDGAQWRTLDLQGDVAIHLVARSALGTYAGVSKDGSRYFRSLDGQAWQPVAGPKGTAFRHMTFGYGKRTSACP